MTIYQLTHQTLSQAEETTAKQRRGAGLEVEEVEEDNFEL